MKTIVIYLLAALMITACGRTVNQAFAPKGPPGIDSVDGQPGNDGIDGQDGQDGANGSILEVHPLPTKNLCIQTLSDIFVINKGTTLRVYLDPDCTTDSVLTLSTNRVYWLFGTHMLSIQGTNENMHLYVITYN